MSARDTVDGCWEDRAAAAPVPMLLVAAGALVASPMRLVSPAASPAVAARTPAAPLMGVTVKTTKPGDGKTYPKAGQIVKAHYTGRLLDGRVFDSSYSRGSPLTFKVGVREVIAGWDEGILGGEGVPPMKVGGKRVLTIPANLAYGSRGAGGGLIPPDATLKFDVELVQVL